ncbi:olfactory marker protein a [Brachyhypopomus gauderio]|uniref:olfactory marker protein a n=1 Tax=Brachyhypopomus gauderio TaxID=698409 RepID=UPI00404249EB
MLLPHFHTNTKAPRAVVAIFSVVMKCPKENCKVAALHVITLLLPSDATHHTPTMNQLYVSPRIALSSPLPHIETASSPPNIRNRINEVLKGAGSEGEEPEVERAGHKIQQPVGGKSRSLITAPAPAHMEGDSQPSDPATTSEMELPFTEDVQLTELMRLRVRSLQQRGQRRQEGERLLLPHEAVYRLDFAEQDLTFSHWKVTLGGPGRLSVTGISQLWTPDLTNLMTRQLLEPTGQFWRTAGEAPNAPIKCLEADIQEFGERIAELAKVRKVMYFLFAFKEGAEKDGIQCSLVFKKNAEPGP